MNEPVRIAGVQGFYGDSPFGAMNIVMEGAADYLMHDALAELTLSILQKDRLKDENLGYARDIEILANILYPTAIQKGIKIVTDSGGLNPEAGAKKVAEILARNGVTGAKIAVITGDDVLARLKEFKNVGLLLEHLDTNEDFDFSPERTTHANVYVGAACIAEALDNGADIILAGRVADPCLALGILIHHYKWSMDDLDRMASGIVVGHVLECGGQASGGNSYAEWPMDYKISNLGYPIAHVFEDGSVEFTKLESQGGKMSRNTVREQLVYEIHDPANYITPDVTVDLTQITLEEVEKNKVRLSGVRGKTRPEKLKLAIGQMQGYLSDQFFFFSWPYAYQKAQKFITAVEEIWSTLPITIDRQEFQLIGINGIHGSAAPEPNDAWKNDMNEIGIRIAIQHADKRTGKIAMQAIIGLGLNGPPGVVGIPGWGKPNRIQLGLWPTLIPRDLIEMKVEIIES